MVVIADAMPAQEKSEVVRDEVAFAAVFAGSNRALVRLAYVLTGDAEAACDVVADAFARTYPKWRRGGVVDLDAYLRRAVVNGVRGRARRRAIVRRAAASGQGDGTHIPGVDEEAVVRDALRRALAGIPVRQRAAIVLRYLEDRSEAEVAAILGVSIGTVKSQVSRGLDHLRTVIAHEEEER